MSSNATNPLHKAWDLWKSLHLPWRKRFFVGRDPTGNTYYELRQPRGDDAAAATSYRRLVYYPRSTEYSEVRVPPAWHQWLRHQRHAPPTMAEQLGELRRQARVKVLAAEADARWEAKGSLLDMPPAASTNATAATAGATAVGSGQAAREPGQGDRIPPEPRRREGRGEDGPAEQKSGAQKTESPSRENPWKQADRSAPGEKWQPEGWTPTPVRKR
ncbi:hypothetical protein F4825DRAFT_171835 [Nemania diffusa]|nr:hypothetical protein F4825DRAFT_171835 [Nemania diffusa]